MIWFTSDTHFNHKNILEYCARPYYDVIEMNNQMIEQWNSQVRPQDTVYLLGDFTLSHDAVQIASWITKLKGSIKLIPGNHDWWIKEKKVIDYLQAYHKEDWARWEIRPWMDFLKHNKKKIIMSHYPLESWREDIHLHGHTHGKSAPKEGRLDVGWDNIPHKLISLDEIMAKFT